MRSLVILLLMLCGSGEGYISLSPSQRWLSSQSGEAKKLKFKPLVKLRAMSYSFA